MRGGYERFDIMSVAFCTTWIPEGVAGRKQLSGLWRLPLYIKMLSCPTNLAVMSVVVHFKAIASVPHVIVDVIIRAAVVCVEALTVVYECMSV
jgi:hypothetical protein